VSSVFVRSYKTREGTRYRVLAKTAAHPNGITIASGLTSKRKADELARAAKQQTELVRAGVVVVAPLVSEVVDTYLQTLEGEWAVTARRYATLHLLPVVGRYELTELRRSHVVDLADAVRAKVSSQTTRHVIGILRAAINKAIDREVFVGANVALRVIVKSDDRRTQQVLRPDEIAPVLAHVRADVRDYVGLTLACAARPGETLEALVADVNVADHTVLFRETKTGVDRVAVVPAYAWPWMERALADAGQSPWLFPLARAAGLVRDRKLTRHLAQAMRAAILDDGVVSLAAEWRYICHKKCVPDEHRATRLVDRRCPVCSRRRLELVEPRDVKFREVRHTGGTLLLEAGLSYDDVAAQMGHDPRVLRKHYDASRPTRRRKEMDRVTLPGTAPAAKERA
jgi:integrase